MNKPLKIQLLGNFHLTFNDDSVPGVESPRLQSFLAYLLIHRQAPLTAPAACLPFWPDSGESQARTNLRNMLYRLREALPAADDFLEIGSQTLGWKPDSPFRLDLINLRMRLPNRSNRQRKGPECTPSGSDDGSGCLPGRSPSQLLR